THYSLILFLFKYTPTYEIYTLSLHDALPICTFSHFDADAMRKGIKSSRFKNTPPGMFFLGDPGFQGGKAGLYNGWWNFSPRLGLAWDVRGDGRTAVRTSIGKFYDFAATQFQNPATAPPWFQRYILNNVSFENPWSTFPGGDPFPQPFG